MSTEREEKGFRFSLRDLALVTAGTSVLICGLSWVGQSSGVHPLFYVLYSLPIAGGMGGLLLGRFLGGVLGAFAGAIVLAILLVVLR